MRSKRRQRGSSRQGYLAFFPHDPQGPVGGNGRVLRGASFGNFVANVRVSFRSGERPGSMDSSIGFRCGGEVGSP